MIPRKKLPDIQPALNKRPKKNASTAAAFKKGGKSGNTAKIVESSSIVALSDTIPALDYIRTHFQTTFGFTPTRSNAACFALHSFKATKNLPRASKKLRTITTDYTFYVRLPAKHHARLLEIAEQLSLYPAAALAVVATAVALKIHYHKKPETAPKIPKKPKKIKKSRWRFGKT